MAQWHTIQQNSEIFQKMKSCYPPLLPLEVRYFLCEWIEEQQWGQIDEKSIPYAQQLIHQMLELLQLKIEELDRPELFPIRVKLEEAVKEIYDIVDSRPLDLVRTIRNCLELEARLIRETEQDPQQQQMNPSSQAGDNQGYNEKIVRGTQSLLQRAKSTENDLKKLQEKQESFIISFSDGQRITAQLQQLSKHPQTPDVLQKKKQYEAQKERLDRLLTVVANDLFKHRCELAKEYEQTILSLQELQSEILDNELLAWKRKQQLAGNGFDMTNPSLDTLQKWCESLADLIWQNRQQIKNLTQMQVQLPIRTQETSEDLMPNLNEAITNLLSSLVTSTFVVEQQPPQVLKKDSRFGAVVRLLVGVQLNLHMNPPLVKASIINEQQASELLKPNSDFKAKDNSCGEILNNSGNMEYQQSSGKLSITFKNMQLKKIKRADRKGSEAVTEEKFCIFFESEFSVGGNEIKFQVWTLSLPLVVIVHGSQECSAAATVLWDNGFPVPGRLNFAVPDQVEWNLLAEQLNMKFRQHTGKGLSDINMAYIAFRLFGKTDPSTCKITWAQFNKDALCSKTSFTLWEWFYAIKKLTKEHFKNLWIDDAIFGFISRRHAENLLSEQSVGTFLLRFSDTELGGITIAWTAEKKPLNIEPFTSKDLLIVHLADRLKDLTHLLTLYPNKPKDDVFSKYYTTPTENVSAEGYIRSQLKTIIPEVYKPGMDTEIKQPYSNDSLYDTSQSLVQSNKGFVLLNGELPDDLAMDVIDYNMTGGIEVIDCMSEELIPSFTLTE